MEEIRRISNRAELIRLAGELKVGRDWHEPDEQEVSAEFHGRSFDTTGCWGTGVEAELLARNADFPVEMYVTLRQGGKPVADINLALLLAWACGYESG